MRDNLTAMLLPDTKFEIRSWDSTERYVDNGEVRYLKYPFEIEIAEYKKLTALDGWFKAVMHGIYADGTQELSPVWMGGDAGAENDATEAALEQEMFDFIEKSEAAFQQAFLDLWVWKNVFVEVIFGRGGMPVGVMTHNPEYMRLRLEKPPLVDGRVSSAKKPNGYVLFDEETQNVLAQFEMLTSETRIKTGARYMIHLSVKSLESRFYGCIQTECLENMQTRAALTGLAKFSASKRFPKAFGFFLFGPEFVAPTPDVPDSNGQTAMDRGDTKPQKIKATIEKSVKSDGDEVMVIAASDAHSHKAETFELTHKTSVDELTLLGANLRDQLLSFLNAPPFRFGIVEDGQLGNTSSNTQLQRWAGEVAFYQTQIERGLLRKLIRLKWPAAKGVEWLYKRVNTDDLNADAERYEREYRNNVITNGEWRARVYPDLDALDDIERTASNFLASDKTPAEPNVPPTGSASNLEFRAVVALQEFMREAQAALK